MQGVQGFQTLLQQSLQSLLRAQMAECDLLPLLLQCSLDLLGSPRLSQEWSIGRLELG